MSVNLVLKRGRTAGSVLLITLAACSIIGYTLAAYLSLIGAQNASVMRSMTWNAGLPAAEAGIEEALCPPDRETTACPCSR